MGGKTLKLVAGLVILWLISMLLIANHYRSTFTTKEQIYELDSALQGLRESLSLDAPSRIKRADVESLDLQLVYALRLQIEAHGQDYWFVPDTQQLFYTTDRYIEQTQIYLDNNINLLMLVEAMRTMRTKYQFEPEILQLYLKLATNVLDAIFSENDSNPAIYRELDDIYTFSETLPAQQAKDLQSALAQVSQVLSGYAQSQYILKKLMNHDVYAQVNAQRIAFNSLLTNYILMAGGITLLTLCLLVGLMAYSLRYSQPVKKTSKSLVTTPPRFEAVEPVSENVEKMAMTELKDQTEIDFDKMLDSLSNDIESVCMLLEVFIEDHTGDAERIQQLLRDAPQDAQRKAHSLKGVGGNLAAMKLREVAGEVELAIKSGQQPSDSVMKELKLRLDRAIDESEQFLQSHQS